MFLLCSSGPVRSAHLSGFDILYFVFFLSFLVFFGYVLWYLGNASLVCWDFFKSFILDLNLMIVMTILSIIRSLCSRFV